MCRELRLSSLSVSSPRDAEGDRNWLKEEEVADGMGWQEEGQKDVGRSKEDAVGIRNRLRNQMG